MHICGVVISESLPYRTSYRRVQYIISMIDGTREIGPHTWVFFRRWILLSPIHPVPKWCGPMCDVRMAQQKESKMLAQKKPAIIRIFVTSDEQRKRRPKPTREKLWRRSKRTWTRKSSFSQLFVVKRIKNLNAHLILHIFSTFIFSIHPPALHFSPFASKKNCRLALLSTTKLKMKFPSRRGRRWRRRKVNHDFQRNRTSSAVYVDRHAEAKYIFKIDSSNSEKNEFDGLQNGSNFKPRNPN